ncbi:carbamoyltransferase HypF [Campylobacter sp.]|uniref:carbamoyltransferase HypF n=1 Tax=Campylobacter sp. TaxID=205 RepID=UPI0026DC39AB|nr:carbamoyltransferase HypF [Campylobacter sp.]MDO4673939.1 carbamoyltransferase HypF [Campylobacter sp.]
MSHFAFRLEISGLVQGVGFRPLAHSIAHELGFCGWVRNSGFGVELVLFCDGAKCEEFVRILRHRLPPLARIDSLKITKIWAEKNEGFVIENSADDAKTTPILSDFALCEACREEFYDPQNPRHLYPFIICTHCGPRFSLIKTLPYDRANTTMAAFPMCDFCKSEFEDPKNRRFHAQPVSCPECKIPVFLKDKRGAILARDGAAFVEAARLLREGKILAVKGIGGFHLMCDALNDEALRNLRARKNRPAKPFALMCPDLSAARKLAHIGKIEAQILTSKEAPIVLLRAKSPLPLIAPNIHKIGIMLAHTPFHLLLFEHFSGVLVATSANLSGESIIHRDEILQERLSGVFDFVLSHEREIHNPSDDSLVQIFDEKPMFLRMGRAFRPSYVAYEGGRLGERDGERGGNFLALGSELKNEWVIFYANRLLLSGHIGDLRGVRTQERFFKSLDFFTQNYGLDFERILCDAHPHFHAAKAFEGPLKIQHHYAHFCAAYFEFKEHFDPDEKALGFIFDGTGYGEDGSVWGGELLWANLKAYERVGHFARFKLINADVKNVQNLALSLIWHYDLEEEAGEFLAKIPPQKLSNLKKIHRASSLWTSSLGRVIDGFAALVFGTEKISYEAELGLLCERFYDADLDFSYALEFRDGQVDFRELVLGALRDEKGRAVTGFFNALADFIVRFSQDLRGQVGEEFKVILSGGVFQNKTLLEILKRKNFVFFVPLRYPCNDSSIALGQMVHFLNLSKDDNEMVGKTSKR